MKARESIEYTLEERQEKKEKEVILDSSMVEHAAVNWRRNVCRFLYILIRICKEKGTNKHSNRNEAEPIGDMAY